VPLHVARRDNARALKALEKKNRNQPSQTKEPPKEEKQKASPLNSAFGLF